MNPEVYDALTNSMSLVFALAANVSGTDAEISERRSIAEALRKNLVTIREGIKVTEYTSDGFHTFKELYHHRAVLFSLVVLAHGNKAWKSKLHHDGTMYDNMFIVGIDTPMGQATYHFDIDPYWNYFVCEEKPKAPEWDGHTPDQSIRRFLSLNPLYEEDFDE